MTAVEASPKDDRAARLRWLALLFLCLAPILVVAWTQDIGAHAYDAATEHIYRGVAFSAAITDGDLYPRWSQVLHWGLGSPLFTFQPPLPYYGMDLLYRLGLPHALGWRWLMALGYALAFAGAYLLARRLGAARWPALVAAIAFAYAPYVIRNGLERGSNEAFSVFLYPLVLWSLLRLGDRFTAGRFILATVVWAACIGSHVLGPLMLAPIAIVLAVVLWRRQHTLAPLLALVAGVLLTAFIWAPMGGPWGSEQAWVHVERDFNKPEAMPAQNPLPITDLLAPPVVYDVTRDNNKTGDRAGLPQTVLLLAGIPATLYLWRRNRRLALVLGAATMVGLSLFFLFTTWSDWLWRLGGAAAAKLLYRTRLMGLEALAAAVTTGLLLMVLPSRWQRIAAAALAALLLVLALPSLYVQYQHASADFGAAPGLTGVRAMEIRHGGSALTAFGEFEPKWRSAPFDDTVLKELGPDFDAQAQPLANPAPSIVVQSAGVSNSAWDLELSANEPVTATLHLLYYPRWQASLDGQAVTLAPQPETGYAQVALPAGPHRLALRYRRTAVETAGSTVSGATVLALGGMAVWIAFRRRPYTTAVERSSGAVRVGAQAGPPLALLIGLGALLILKVAVIDPHTTLLRCVSTGDQVCGADATVNGLFVGAPALRGYSVGSYEVAAGDEVQLKLFWQADAPVDRSLASFVHVRPSSDKEPPNPHAENGMWAQAERRSWDGLLSQEFVPGKIYEDDYRVSLPGDMPTGEYFLEVGWFDTMTGEQADVPPGSVQAPLRILWRSVLLPNLHVRGEK